MDVRRFNFLLKFFISLVVLLGASAGFFLFDWSNLLFVEKVFFLVCVFLFFFGFFLSFMFNRVDRSPSPIVESVIDPELVSLREELKDVPPKVPEPISVPESLYRLESDVSMYVDKPVVNRNILKDVDFGDDGVGISNIRRSKDNLEDNEYKNIF